MESSAFDRITRLFGSTTRRRTALAAATATGLAALTGGTADAQQQANDEELAAERRRRRRRRRRGPQGPPGPLAGAFIVMVQETCSETSAGGGDVIACEAQCPPQYVASGGGFNVGDILETLGTVRASEPILSPGGRPVGWSVSLEFFNAGQQFDFSAYALCIPA